MKKLFITLGFLSFVGVAYAAPNLIYQRSILPETTNLYDIGTSTAIWNGVFTNAINAVGANATSTFTGGIKAKGFDGTFATLYQLLFGDGTATSSWTGGATTTTNGDLQARRIYATDSISTANLFAYINGKTGTLVATSTADLQGNVFNSTGALTFTQNGQSNTNILLNPTTGNVGIGTTSPATTFSVNGEMYTNATLGVGRRAISNASITVNANTTRTIHNRGTDNTSANYIDFSSLDSSTVGMYYGYDNSTGNNFFTGSGLANAGIVGMSTNHALVFGTNNATRMVIAAGGNIGIGTTSPSMKLAVDGTGFAGITSGGYIGVGISAPSTPVHILNGSAQLRLDGGTTGSAVLQLYNSISGAGRRNWDIITENTAAGDFAIRESTAAGGAPETIRFYIDNGGNVGIGTSTPYANINIGAKVLDVTASGANQAAVVLHNAGGTQELSILNNASAGAYFDVAGSATASNNFFSFRTSNTASSNSVTERMRIQSDGNVGIGTTSPWGVLAVQNTGSGPSFVVADEASVTGDPTPFVIDAGGNVGIGTTSPSMKLAVDGTGFAGITSGGYIGVGISAPSTPIHILNGGAQLRLDGGTTGSAVLQLYNSIAGAGRRNWDIITENSAAGDFSIRESTAAGGAPATTRLYIASGGNVGIGTTSPTALLSVGGNAVASKGIYMTATGIGIGRNAPTVPLSIVSTANSGIRLTSSPGTISNYITFDEVAGNQTNSYVGNEGDTAGGTFTGTTAYAMFIGTGGNIGNGAKNLQLMANSAVRMTIDTTGNVGVASTSPWRTFGVTGTMGVSSSITDASGTPGTLCYNTSSFEVTKNNALTCTVSDRNQKNSIKKLSVSALDIVDRMQPIQFRYNDSDRVRWGFIAQDLQAISTQLGDGYKINKRGELEAKSIDIHAIDAIQTKAIQELRAENKDLRARIEKLEKMYEK